MKLPCTVLECPKCGRWTEVEAIGKVVATPLCKVCKVPQKILTLTQLSWKF